jgi:hypothetical protein
MSIYRELKAENRNTYNSFYISLKPGKKFDFKIVKKTLQWDKKRGLT